ncbi:MAG: efflux RND transporter periplasmic adaptor subunit [Candidatus Kryptoniota bacterium]
MKKAFLIAVPILIIAIGFLIYVKLNVKGNHNGEEKKPSAPGKERKVLYWYDPMNPTIHFDHPGKSPMMDMDLVPRYADEQENNPNIVKVDPAMVQNFGVMIAPVEKRKLTRTVYTYGVVSPDEKRITDVNTRVSGWVEKLYFDYTGMNVRGGQEMAVIYSPDLIAAEQEYLQAISFSKVSNNTVTQSDQLINSARERLKFFGMSDKEIEQLALTKKVIDRVVIHSPANGVILEKNVFEGQRISAGQSLFRVVDLSRVWILADVFKIDFPYLKVGIPASVFFNDSEKFTGKVDFIYPEVDATARSVKARIEINNPHLKLKIGEYVNVAIHSPVSFDALSVPSQAVINTGLRKVVAVSLGDGKFEIRDVTLGAYADGYYEVLSGLQEGEDVVTSGQFLIDSDANLKSAGAAMSGMPGMSAPAESTLPSSSGSREGKGNMEMKKGLDSSSGNNKKMDNMDMHDMQMDHEKHNY